MHREHLGVDDGVHSEILLDPVVISGYQISAETISGGIFTWNLYIYKLKNQPVVTVTRVPPPPPPSPGSPQIKCVDHLRRRQAETHGGPDTPAHTDN